MATPEEQAAIDKAAEEQAAIDKAAEEQENASLQLCNLINQGMAMAKARKQLGL